LTFAPLTLPDPVSAYRSGNGAPGPGYWQRSDYELCAELDTAAKQLKASETISYTNNKLATFEGGKYGPKRDPNIRRVVSLRTRF
jgi:hypothetical protein